MEAFFVFLDILLFVWYDKYNNKMKRESYMNILITGAASGIGNALTQKMLSMGHTVWALDIIGIAPEERLVPLCADITREEDLQRISEKLRTDAVTLDSLICVAGIHRMASLVESETDTLSRVIDVNLIGTMLTCRILHSLLAPKGRVFIVTSEVASFDPLPFNGLYNVSKTALDAYAQALRQELGLIGQKVITIRPGAVETPLQNSSLSATEQLAATTKLYQKQSKHFLFFVKHFMGKPMKAEKMAEKIARIHRKRHPKLIYKIHQNAGLVLLSLLPKRLQCAVIRALLNRS